MWDKLKRLFKARQDHAENESNAYFHPRFWGCTGYEVSRDGAGVTGGLFALWHYPPTDNRPLAAYVTYGIGAEMGVEFLCFAREETTSPHDDPFAHLLMETALFTPAGDPTMRVYDVVPISPGLLPEEDMTHALFAPPEIIMDLAPLEAQTGFTYVLVVPVFSREVALIQAHSGELFLRALLEEGLWPTVHRSREILRVSSSS